MRSVNPCVNEGKPMQTQKTRTMAEADNNPVTFDLGDFLLEDPLTNEQIQAIELPESVVQAIEQNLMETSGQEAEKPNEVMAPPKQKGKSKCRHVLVTEEDVDDTSDASISPNTKGQTRWAVTIFKGNCL